MKIKNLKLIVITLTGVIAISGAVLFFFASATTQAQAVYQLRCRLSVFPFNPDANGDIIGEEGDMHLNRLDTPTCESHLTYGSAYQPQPPTVADNPVKEGSENMRVPIAKHQHAYFDDSNADGTDLNYYYKSFVDKFEITIQGDGVANIDLDAISCDTPIPVNYEAPVSPSLTASGCNGEDTFLYGGTRISTANPASDKLVITWDFATQSPYGGRPAPFGNNGSGFVPLDPTGNPHYIEGETTPITLDLTNPENRKLQFGVNLPTFNHEEQLWSATTSSRALLAHLAIHRDAYDTNFGGCSNGDPRTGWCYLPVPGIGNPGGYTNTVSVTTPSGSHTYFWYPIGSVASVWKKPEVVPPTEVCESITLSHTQFDTISASQSFSITNVAPPIYTGNFTWHLENAWPGAQLMTIEDPRAPTRNAVLINPTPNTNPNQNATITVRSEDGQCTRTIPSINPVVTPPPPAPPPPPVVQPPPPPPPGGGGGNPCYDLFISPTEFVSGLVTQSFTATINPINFTGTIAWIHTKNGTQIGQAFFGNRATFTDISAESVVRATAYPSIDTNRCTKEIRQERLPLPPPPLEALRGILTKRAFEIRSHGNVIKKNETAEFEVSFRPLVSAAAVTIKEEAMRTTLHGSRGGEITLVRGAFNGNDFKIERRRGNGVLSEIPSCGPVRTGPTGTTLTPTICFEGSPFSPSGITIRNFDDQIILITYRGELTTSNISEAYCRTLDRTFCGEEFINRVTDSLNNDAQDRLFTPCPFLLTQGLGDVILQRDLSVGSDISSCAGIPNIEGPTITPTPPATPEQPKTGPGEVLNIAPHTLCQKSNLDIPGLPEAYRNPLKSVSSAVCELSLTLADRITPPKIRADVLENITRITRFNNNLGEGRDIIVADLSHPPVQAAMPNPNFEVYKLKNANLIVDRFSLPVSKGSRTYVIENGDIIINNNITYTQEPLDITQSKNIPVIAFIVINGSVRIAPHVTQVAGIFVTLKGDRAESGKVTGTAQSLEPIKINGSVYGDIEPLFESRSYVGNARRGEGTVVINYDGRLFYNMPPGLQEILDVSPEQVAR